jgi:hypothetical protein
MPTPTIEASYIDQFSRDLREVYQQRGSRLRKTITSDPLAAENGYFDFIGTMTVSERTGRAQEVVVNPADITRRKCSQRVFESSDYVDKFEQKIVSSPLSQKISSAAAMALGRQQDTMIVQRALGPNYGGRDGTTVYTLPGSQTIANTYNESGGSTSTNLTTDKLRLALTTLTDAEAIEGDDHAKITVVYTAFQVQALLSAAEALKVTGTTYEALASGNPDVMFMGMRFVRVQSKILPITGTIRSIIAYSPDALNYCNVSDIEVEMNYIPNKKSWLVSADFQGDAARLRENGVVQIQCDESVVV